MTSSATSFWEVAWHLVLARIAQILRSADDKKGEVLAKRREATIICSRRELVKVSRSKQRRDDVADDVVDVRGDGRRGWLQHGEQFRVKSSIVHRSGGRRGRRPSSPPSFSREVQNIVKKVCFTVFWINIPRRKYRSFMWLSSRIWQQLSFLSFCVKNSFRYVGFFSTKSFGNFHFRVCHKFA